MSTYVQGIEYIRLVKEGWVAKPLPETDSETIQIGGPVEMISPDGEKFLLMPDGTLKELPI